MPVRGIRGTTVVLHDTAESVLEATRELLETLLTVNEIAAPGIASVIVVATPHITSEYPARAARQLGWNSVALLGATEMDVPGGLARRIRVLMHVNTERAPSTFRHVYLHEARPLRPDH